MALLQHTSFNNSHLAMLLFTHASNRESFTLPFIHSPNFKTARAWVCYSKFPQFAASLLP